jgi:hypothetical protein
MPCNVNIGGGRPEDNQRVRDVLKSRYEDVLGAHDIAITYEPGNGYRVISATCTTTHGQAYAPGDRFNVEPATEDVTEDVKGLLREAGIKVLP